MPDLNAETLRTALRAAGIPEEFSVVPVHHEVPRAIMRDIEAFIDVFERVTTNPRWQEGVTAMGPAIAQHRRPEVCFFSAWDFHLPPQAPDQWQLIEFNDNGSGFLFAAITNDVFYRSGMLAASDLESPETYADFGERLLALIERETQAFFGGVPPGMFIILDDAGSMQRGRFREELRLLAELLRRHGWSADIAHPGQLRWDGGKLHGPDAEVSFIVNRSTDFLWEGEAFAPLRRAYLEGRVYVAPNPFTYATRSDKRLLEFLSLPAHDEELNIEPRDRAVLSRRVPETHLIREANLDELARRKDEFFFKPLYGHAGRGVLPSAQVGRSRLRRFLKKGQPYVAQRTVPKSRLTLAGTGNGVSLWADLRVWAYRGERLLISSRASREPELLDLAPPGGWLPTYVRA